MSPLDSLYSALVQSFSVGEPFLTVREIAVLLHLRSHVDESTCEISEALFIPKPAVTRALDGLVTSGLVHRKRNPNDLRYVRVALSVSGRCYLERLEARLVPAKKQRAA
jgi:DNA-binding MarR family transcriptional regulator